MLSWTHKIFDYGFKIYTNKRVCDSICTFDFLRILQDLKVNLHENGCFYSVEYFELALLFHNSFLYSQKYCDISRCMSELPLFNSSTRCHLKKNVNIEITIVSLLSIIDSYLCI